MEDDHDRSVPFMFFLLFPHVQSKKPAHQIMVNDIVKVCASDKGTSNTFEVHFRGNGSPWVLDAGSEV